MADVFEDRLEGSYQDALEAGEAGTAIASTCPRSGKFVGFDAYQKVLDAGPDLVILATPPGFRPIHFEAAVKAGKHVFMEKPVATDAPGVRRVLAAAEEAKKKNLAVGVGSAAASREHLPGNDQAAAGRRDRRHRRHARLLERLDALGQIAPS